MEPITIHQKDHPKIDLVRNLGTLRPFPQHDQSSSAL